MQMTQIEKNPLYWVKQIDMKYLLFILILPLMSISQEKLNETTFPIEMLSQLGMNECIKPDSIFIIQQDTLTKYIIYYSPFNISKKTIVYCQDSNCLIRRDDLLFLRLLNRNLELFCSNDSKDKVNLMNQIKGIKKLKFNDHQQTKGAYQDKILGNSKSDFELLINIYSLNYQEMPKVWKNEDLINISTKQEEIYNSYAESVLILIKFRPLSGQLYYPFDQDRLIFFDPFHYKIALDNIVSQYSLNEIQEFPLKK